MRPLFLVCALLCATTVAVADDFDFSAVKPLTDLGTAYYRWGLTGGLFEDGSNVMAPDHFAKGLEAAAKIQPLDADGQPSANGKIVFLAIGFGETMRIMQSFMAMAENDRRVDREHLVLLNGARDGADYHAWAERPDGMPTYDVVERDVLAPAGVSPMQVQVAWVEIINQAGLPFGTALADGFRLKTFIAATLREMKRQYPNLQVAYLSSRTYGGYSNDSYTAEPNAFESGYSNRWIVTTQMEQERMEVPEWHWDSRVGLIDPRRGVAPWVTWGPYLWANGPRRREDGLAWLRSDFEADGQTLSPTGAAKGAKLLFDFLLHEPTAKEWFRSGVEPLGKGRAARH